MNGGRRLTGRGGTVRGAAGFSFIEVMVSLSVAVIIGFGLYAVYNAQRRSSTAQKTYNDLQSSCSFAMDTVKNDILLAGYRAKNPDLPVTAATASSITFEFLDDHASTDPPYDDLTQYDNHTEVTYALVGSDLRKTIRRWHKPTGAYSTPTTFTLASNVNFLNFEYRRDDNSLFTPNTTVGSPDYLDKIRLVQVSLQCEAERANALYTDATRAKASDKFQTITLTSQIKARNLGLVSNPQDTTGPSEPHNLIAWDEGQCGCLSLRWDSSADTDIAGYTIYYGLSSGVYSRRIRVNHQSGTYQRATLRDLTSTKVPYFIAVGAYDKSGNPSDLLSNEVTGNPTADTRSETQVGTNGNDTTINPDPPPAPSGFAASTPADGQILLSWTTSYADCLATKVHGYRIYRSTNPSFAATGAQAGQGTCVADETTLGPDATSYLDKNLIGCVPYYYQIAQVHCDKSDLTAYTAGLATRYTTSQFAATTGTPTDGTPTRPPTLLAKAGYRRIILTLTNPVRTGGNADPDFAFTRIYFSTAGYPHVDSTTGNVIDPAGGPAKVIPDGGGSFSQGGSVPAINFDSETVANPGPPELQEDATYFFLAIAYDRCGNRTTDQDTQAKAEAEQCNDCVAGEECRDAPPAPSNVQVTEGCGGTVRLDWDMADTIADPDFQGYQVWRCEGVGCSPETQGINLTGPYLAWSNWYVDDTVDGGRNYTYRIKAGDCYYQRWLEHDLNGEEIGANDPLNNVSYSDKAGISVGVLDRSRVEGGAETFLTAAVDDAATTFEVDDTAGFTTTKFAVGSEIVEYLGTTGTSFTGCLRGAEATFAIPHFAGAVVASWPPPPPITAAAGDLTLSPPTFRHNIVRFGMENTADATLTLKRLGLSWENTEAFFQKLDLGDGDLTPVSTPYNDTGNPLTNASTGATVTLADPVVSARDTEIPVKMTFLRADRTADRYSDMREEQVDLTWYYRNDSTGDESCSMAWLTGTPTGLVVPLGPVVSGVTQNYPTAGTIAWPVPGAAGANYMNAVTVTGGANVRVLANVASDVGLDSVRLYYYADPSLVYSAAPPVSGTYPSCTPYAMVDMENLAGETWSAEIPSRDNQNVWYFIVAVDHEGNFDREPEIDAGAFQYYQQPGDICNNKPLPPTLTGTYTTTNVQLSWTAPTHNTDGTECKDIAGFQVWGQIGQRGWVQLADLADPSATGYTHTPPIAATRLTALVSSTATTIPVLSTAGFLPSGTIRVNSEYITYSGTTATEFTGCVRGTLPGFHSAGSGVVQNVLLTENLAYYVAAYDSCPGQPRVSDASGVYIECEGAPACSLTLIPSASPFHPGGTFTLDVAICGKIGSGRDTVYVQTCSQSGGDADAVRMVEEEADNGIFHVDAASYGRDYVQAFLAADYPASPTDLDLRVNATDTITVGGWAWPLPSTWGATCQSSGYSCGAPVTLSLSADPCAADHTPSGPAGFTQAASGNCGSTKVVDLAWVPVAPPDTGYSTFTYELFYCDAGSATGACTPDTAIPTTPTCSSTQCTATATMPTKLADVGQTVHRYYFGVRAVYTLSGCASSPWHGPMAVIGPDGCN